VRQAFTSHLDVASTGSRSARRNWVIPTAKLTLSPQQLKKDYLAGVGDSLDLVVVGGYYGKGKRTNVYGAFLLACYDADSEEYQTICKIGTGFSEEALAAHYAVLQPLETDKARGDVKVGGAKPDVWFEPKVVWEVLTADLSLSPIYTAAQGLVRVDSLHRRWFRWAYLNTDRRARSFVTVPSIHSGPRRQRR
jgi:DNA ligase 1